MRLEAIAPGVERVQCPSLDGRLAAAFLVGRLLVEPTFHDEREALWWVDFARARGVAAVFLTHQHTDHTLGPFALARHLGLPFYGPPGRRTEHVVEAGQEVLGWRVVHTPGHAPEHLCLFDGEALIAGDMLEASHPVFIPPEHAGGSPADYRASLAELGALPIDLVLPSHGPPFRGGRDRIARLLEAPS